MDKCANRAVCNKGKQFYLLYQRMGEAGMEYTDDEADIDFEVVC